MSSASLRKGAKGKPAADPAPESPAVATPSSPPTEPPAEPPPASVDPAPPPSPLVVETPPVAPPAEPRVIAPPPAPPPPPINPNLARVEVGTATSTTGTTASNVNKTIAPLAPKFTACYRSSLAHQTHATDEGGVLHVETNEDGIIMDAQLNGPLAVSAGKCIIAAVRGRRISNVDTGSASADVPIAFKVR